MVINMISNKISLNDLFDYDFKIYQNDDYFKFSIDSILLAEFIFRSNIKNKKIIDLCSGNAAIPLILTSKYGKIDLTGIELQKEIFELGEKSIKYNNVDNINFINDNINNAFKYFEKHSFDIVTCNPPYFENVVGHQINENSIKAIARHEVTTNLDEVISISASLLKNAGYFYLVHRADRLIEIIEKLNKYKFGIKRICFCYNNHESNSCFMLVESVYNGKNYVKINKPIFIKDYDSYKDIFEEV